MRDPKGKWGNERDAVLAARHAKENDDNENSEDNEEKGQDAEFGFGGSSFPSAPNN